ncbi:hypothetical protein AB0407_36075 [Streptomyces microflavus]|uniref:hypothetical protein n=1 Tax=Streptomyces TaxID=1883 RepID=UPI0008237FDD|nr:hypothetical protein [Streptomyces sp. ScaeMP-e48]SCK54243.1 DNA-binding response regulator, NarL/FixJ family, contains REC and HTH domains [Streptomyces sp. ScaeMP-e48]
MRILVIDDMVTLHSGVARAVESDGHEVTGVIKPGDLENLLIADPDYQLAFVDIDYAHITVESGLVALETLEKHGIPSVLYCADAEVNRLLYILAAFEFFPRTCTLLSKHAGDTEVHRVVTSMARGDRPHDRAAERYRPPGGGTSFLHQLIERSTDLALWRALATHSTRALIAKSAHVSESKVDQFTADRHQIILRLHCEVLDLPIPSLTARNSNLVEVCRFARTHDKFFEDKDVERLVRTSWDPAPRQSASKRAGGVFRRKRS